MRDHGGRLTFAPRLPRQLQRLAFGLVFRGRRLAVEVTSEQATYRLLEGEPLEIAHHGAHFQVSTEPVSRKIPPVPERPAPKQPPGREPLHREPAG
jgi:alpha,alpha-trehalose phosphorylase